MIPLNGRWHPEHCTFSTQEPFVGCNSPAATELLKSGPCMGTTVIGYAARMQDACRQFLQALRWTSAQQTKSHHIRWFSIASPEIWHISSNGHQSNESQCLKGGLTTGAFTCGKLNRAPHAHHKTSAVTCLRGSARGCRRNHTAMCFVAPHHSKYEPSQSYFGGAVRDSRKMQALL